MSVYDKFNYPEADLKAAKGMGMKDEEYDLAVKILGRKPNYIEIGIISAMWSEHCSYKSSRIHLKKFPTKADWVVQGPGENAGIIEIDNDICACFKVESHNHPSYIEPFQGAATGVGGILRDVFTMGARPVAAMNSLRFGKLESQKTKSVFEGVVSGIASYGNCFGVPTIGGEINFNECYEKNPLVNAFALGTVDKKKIFYAKAEGVGNPIIYVGAKTGRDGIHGATMASEEFSSEGESKRPNVQIGDPFKEKLLLEACLELMKNDFVIGIQDMGAAGLTSSSFEMASRAGSGVLLELDKVPVREKHMTPYEIMLSESQERMLIVAKKGKETKVKKIFEKWDLDAAVIGKVTNDGFVRLHWEDEEVASLPAKPLSDEAPMYDRPYSEPEWQKELNTLDTKQLEVPANITQVLLKLLSSPNIASKEWVYSQYDHMVRTNSTLLPGSDAAIIRIKESDKSIAISSDCNSRFCYLNPRQGGMIAVAEAARNVAMSGAVPLAITDCLNFGNPEKPEIMWQFVESVEGMAEACSVLSTPVVSGNVSLYNETDGRGIFPTPTTVAVGVIDSQDKMLTSFFQDSDNIIIFIGENRGEIGGSEYLYSIHNLVKGNCPEIELEKEKRLLDFMKSASSKKLIRSAHDISEGGFAVALAEMTFTKKIGAEISLSYSMRDDFYLFGESQTMILIEVEKSNLKQVEKLLRQNKLRHKAIGKTGGSKIIIKNKNKITVNLTVEDAYKAYSRAIGELMR